MLCGVSLRFNVLCDDVLGGASDKRSPEDRELLVGFQATEALGRFHHSSGRPTQRAIAAFRHRFTLRQTLRTVPIMFSARCFGCWVFRCQSSFCWRFSGAKPSNNTQPCR
jgi:hypothetical protein